MVSRLVLGCGSAARSVALALDGRRGDLLVLSADDHRVESLRNEGIDAKRADVTDPDELRTHAGAPDTVVVGSDDGAHNRQTAEAARAAFPEVFLLAYAGEASPADADALRAVADQIVDPGKVIGEEILERVGDAGIRTRRLLGVLRGVDEPLGIFTHDNPDPDAIASAVALRDIAASIGCEAEVCYYGDISHQENRALVNLLEFDLRNREPDEPLEYGGYALVDHSRPGVNDQLPRDTPVDVVIDHHPPRAPVEARFVDLRSEVGATSTLMAGYLRQLDVEPDPSVATGLMFGIHVDTDDFTRGVSPEDFHAAAYLLPHADVGTLERIESPSVNAETLETLANAIRNRRVEGGVLTSCVGQATDRDALAQAADRLLDMDGVTTTLIYGYTGTDAGDMVYVSARARGTRTQLDLGEALRDAFGQIGSAGGHADMAGAQIPVRSLTRAFAGDDPLNSDTVIRDVVTDRFFETLDVGRDRAAPAVYAGDEFLGSVLDAAFNRSEEAGQGDEYSSRQ